MFFRDSRHPAIYMDAPMQKEGFESVVDQLVGPRAGTDVRFGRMDAQCFTTQKLGKSGATWSKKWNHHVFRRTTQNARMMLDEGQDPLRVVCARLPG